MNITEGVILASIAALPNILASVSALIMSIRNANGIKEIKVATDGITSQLVASTREAAFSEGVSVGHEKGVIQEKERLCEVVNTVSALRSGDLAFPEEKRT